MVGLALALEVLPLVPLLIGVLMLLYGISGAYQPSVQASLPLLVPEAGLVQANALVNMVSTLAGLLGAGGWWRFIWRVWRVSHCPCECPVFFLPPLSWSVSFGFSHNGRPRRTVCSGP